MVQFRYLNSLLSERMAKQMPVHAYTNWNKRESDHEEQIELFRKICKNESHRPGNLRV